MTGYIDFASNLALSDASLLRLFLTIAART